MGKGFRNSVEKMKEINDESFGKERAHIPQLLLKSILERVEL